MELQNQIPLLKVNGQVFVFVVLDKKILASARIRFLWMVKKIFCLSSHIAKKKIEQMGAQKIYERPCRVQNILTK